MRLRAIAIAFAIVGALVAITAAPTSAQQAFEVTGEAECTTPGTFTVTWTIETFIGTEGEVTEAVLSGAAEGDITDSFSPNPFEFDDDVIVGSSVISGDTVGTVTLDVTIVYQSKGPFDEEASAELELDGSCEAPPVTDPPPTEAPTTAAVAATTAPRFTG